MGSDKAWAGQTWDVVVVGTGSGGKIAALELARRDKRVLAVEAGRIGGECPYVACVPAKSMLLSAREGLAWADAVARRDEVSSFRDDREARRDLEDQGVTVAYGRGRLAGSSAGMISVVVTDAHGNEGGVEATVVLLAPGSRPSSVDVDGLENAPTWTSDEALSATVQPVTLAILGGGAVGCELAQAYSRLGTRVFLIEPDATLLPEEAGWVGGLIADQLRVDGVEVFVGENASQVRLDERSSEATVLLQSGLSVTAERILMAAGRVPNSSALGLETLDAAVTEDGSVGIDARCRVLNTSGSPVSGLYAAGDVTAESSFTHSANYQARIITSDVVGEGHDADYSAVPRVVYTDPPVFCVGLTPEQASARGIDIETTCIDVGDVERAALLRAAARPPARRRVSGKLEIVVASDSGIVLGAACVGPEADSWGAELSLAVRARLSVSLLEQHLHAFPSWSEVIHTAVSDLSTTRRGRERSTS